MADISLKHEHSLGLEKAKELTEKIANDVQQEFPSLVNSVDWNSDHTQAKLKGKGFTGTFAVTADTMKIDIDLAFFARPFKGKVEEKIKSRIGKYFG